MRVTGASLVAVLVLLVLAGCDRSQDMAGSGTGEATTSSGYGLSITAPAGWHGRIYRLGPRWAVMLDAATFRLPPTGDEMMERATEGMAARDIFIHLDDIGAPPPRLVEGEGWATTSLPVEIERSHLHPFAKGIPLPIAIRPLVINDRAIQFYVVFGSEPTDEMLAEANGTLASLKVAARDTD